MPGDDVTRILVVDDDASMRDIMAAYLVGKGFEATQASEGTAALELLKQRTFDLLLCDVQMPGLNGLELLKEVKRSYSGLPVIMVSGAGFINDVVEALRLGAWDFLLKPFSSLAILEHAVGNCLHRVRLEREIVRYREELEASNRDLQANLAVLRADQEAGRRAQIQLLPENEASYGPYTFSHIFIPSLYLSGDFLDYFALSPRYVCFYIADVSGHGSSSAFITVMLKSLTRQAARRYHEHSDDLVCRADGFLGWLNTELLPMGLSKYLTIFYGVLDLQEDMLTYSVGGHYPGPILVNGGEARFIAGQGMPVGLFEDAAYTSHTLELPEKFSLFMFSDGTLECIDAADLGHKEEALLKVCAGGDLAGVRAGLRLEQRAAPPDDITVFLLNRGG